MSSYEFKCLWNKHLTKIGRLQIVTEPLWRASAYFPKDLFNVSFHIFCEITLKQTCSVYFQGHTFIWVRAAYEILKVMKCIVIIPEREVQMSTHKKTLIFRMFSRTHYAFWKFLSYNTSAASSFKGSLYWDIWLYVGWSPTIHICQVCTSRSRSSLISIFFIQDKCQLPVPDLCHKSYFNAHCSII